MIILGYIDPGVGMTVVGLGAGAIALMAVFFGGFLIFFKRILNFLKKHFKSILAVLLAVAVISVIIGVVMMKPSSDFDKKVIILGYDGLSPELMEPLMERGELPNFSRLKERGSYSRISSTNPSQSPVAWAGFATGRNPGKNGVYDFIVRDPKTYDLSLSLSNIVGGKPRRVIKGKCFWNYATEAGVPSVVIGHPVTFPPDKLNGKMLSGMGVPDILGTEGTFTFYTTDELPENRDVGGKVFKVERSPEMTVDLIGPRVAKAGGADHVKVPVKVSLKEGGAQIECQGRKTSLEVGRWSDWQEVTFKVGLLKKAKGIFKFYLVETDPGFKLYISPINFDPRAPFFQISSPPSYSKELADSLGLYYTQGMPMDTWAVNEKRLNEKAFLEQVEVVLDEKKKMLDLELGRMEKGILFCYFESPDIIQHMFWRFTDPEHPLYEKDAPEEYKDKIVEWYKKLDTILGEVMDRAGEDDTLIVLSDHGFTTFRRAAHINSWLRENGYLELEDPYATSGGELLEGIDWSRTKAYAIGFGAIYINQEGREGKGIVKPGKETEELKAEIARKLKEWRDEKYNTPVVHNAYQREEIFWGEYAGETPDIYIGFNRGYRASWQTALGATPEILLEDNLKKWGGTHLIDPVLIPGVIFSNKLINKEDTSLYDITPTILRIIGFSEEEIEQADLDGKPLF